VRGSCPDVQWTFKPTKVSAAPHAAECAVQLNGNHLHVVEGRPSPKGVQARLADIGLQLDTLSRIDVVAALCVGDDIDQVAQDVSRQRLRARTPEVKAEMAARTRALKLLVGHLRDELPEIDLQPVEGSLEALVAQQQAILREYAAQAGEEGALVPAALSLRMARALRKLVAASARLSGRGEANEEDVLCAAEMMAFKLEVVKWACGTAPEVAPQGSLAQQERWAEATRELRRHKMMEEYGGRMATVEEIAAGTGQGRRTVERDLQQMGLSPQKGQYEVDPDFWTRG
jgi:hypothetical protein